MGFCRAECGRLPSVRKRDSGRNSKPELARHAHGKRSSMGAVFTGCAFFVCSVALGLDASAVPGFR